MNTKLFVHVLYYPCFFFKEVTFPFYSHNTHIRATKNVFELFCKGKKIPPRCALSYTTTRIAQKCFHHKLRRGGGHQERQAGRRDPGFGCCSSKRIYFFAA